MYKGPAPLQFLSIKEDLGPSREDPISAVDLSSSVLFYLYFIMNDSFVICGIANIFVV
jgi:hypothetical protein